jgi:hypothetical protein
MTYRFGVNDILTSLKKTGDDRVITIAHVVYYIQVVANRLNTLSARKKRGDQGKYKTVFAPVAVKLDSLGERKYIDLPSGILGLDNEGGVDYLSYNQETCCCAGPPFADKVFNRTTPGVVNILTRNPYTKPSPSNPYFYRIGEKIFLLGLECISVKDVEICVLTALDPTTTCDLDDEIEIAPHLIQTLRAEVTNMLRGPLVLPSDRVNDGNDSGAEIIRSSGTSLRTEQPVVSDQQIEQQG